MIPLRSAFEQFHVDCPEHEPPAMPWLTTRQSLEADMRWTCASPRFLVFERKGQTIVAENAGKSSEGRMDD